MDLAGVIARQPAVTHHRVPMHAHQAGGFADAAAFGDELQDRKDFLVWLDDADPFAVAADKGQESDVVLGLNLGADDYVTKPFSTKELLARAEAFLRRRRQKEPEVYRFGRCELHTGSRRLVRDGVEVPLTPKEFGLLVLFARHPGRALTRDEILRSVWGDHLLVTKRSVDRFINTLRKKIEPDPKRGTLIRTIRNIGYRFEVG